VLGGRNKKGTHGDPGPSGAAERWLRLKRVVGRNWWSGKTATWGGGVGEGGHPKKSEPRGGGEIMPITAKDQNSIKRGGGRSEKLTFLQTKTGKGGKTP